MLGQLQDAGNTVTLAHYLELLSAAFLVSGVPRWTPGKLRARASSPKLVVWSNALVTAQSSLTLNAFRGRPDRWGRLVENAVGAALLAGAATGEYRLYYWRDGVDEVDFVVEKAGAIYAVEVKSGRPRAARGLETFRRRYSEARVLLVGGGGVPLEDFFSRPVTGWLRG